MDDKGQVAVEEARSGRLEGRLRLRPDDLEAWLEVRPAIALAFAEEIGLESLGRHWQWTDRGCCSR